MSVGNREKWLALEIFDAHPEMQEQIRCEFNELWSLNKERPAT